MESLIKYIAQRITVSPELETAIKKAFAEEIHDSEKLILAEGHYAQKLYFIEKGICVSGVTLDDEMAISGSDGWW